MNAKVSALAGALAALLVLGPADAQSPERTARMDSLLDAYHDARLFSGVAVVAGGDSVLYSGAYGEAVREWDVGHTVDTRFHVGSVTKQFTAALVLSLVADGEASLDGTISSYLPDYPGPGADRITLHHLLSHRSGIPSFTGFADYRSRIMRLEWKPDSLVSEFAGRELEFEPGSEYSYSNSGYFLLGVIVEKLTGRPYAEALERRVLAPLGLGEEIGYAHHHRVIEREAAGYVQTVPGYDRAEFVDSSVPLSAGMLYATAPGLHRWTRALHDGRVLPDSLLEAMTTAHSENGYGYGLAMQTDTLGGSPATVVGHGGGINGFTSSVTHMPASDYTVVVLDNTTSSATSRIAGGLRQLLHGGSPPPPQPSVARVLWDVVREEGVAAATSRYRILQGEEPDAYEFGASELVELGDALRQHDHLPESAGIYEFAVSVDSTSPAAHAGLGLARKEMGREDAAVRHLREAVELNPGKDEAREALRELGIEVETESVDLPRETLERYTGVYVAESIPGFEMTVTREGDRLYARGTGQPRARIYPSSETRFYLEVVDARIVFTVTEDGAVPSLTLHQQGREITFRREEE